MSCNHTAGAGASFYLDTPTEAERARHVFQVVACRGCDLRIGSVSAEGITAAEMAVLRRMAEGWAARRGQDFVPSAS